MINHAGRHVLYLLLLWLVTACGQVQPAMQNTPSIAIHGVIIRNDLVISVTDVQLLVPSTGNFVSCGNIMARSMCATKFPHADYYSQKVVVSWTEKGQSHSTGEFALKIPEWLDLTKPTRLEVMIFSPGEAGAKLLQN